MKVLCATTVQHLHVILADSSSRKLRTVYIVECPKTGRVKIGVTKNTSRRLADLQSFSPTSLTLLASFSSIGKELERYLHSRYAHLRIHGEWFQPDQWMIDDFKSLETFLGSKTATLKRHKEIETIEELNKRQALDISVTHLQSQGFNIDYFNNLPMLAENAS